MNEIDKEITRLRDRPTQELIELVELSHKRSTKREVTCWTAAAILLSERKDQ